MLFKPAATISESATGADTLSAEAQFFAAIQELATATDAISGRKLWEIIDDTQTANWQNINDVQSANWNAVDDTQSAGWTVINTA